MTPVSPQSGNFKTAIFLGCGVPLFLFSPLGMMAPYNLSPAKAEAVMDGQEKTKKAKAKWKAIKAKQLKQHDDDDDDGGVKAKKGASGKCPPGEKPLGRSRKGGCG